MYTFTPQPDDIPDRVVRDEILNWNKTNLRNYMYPRQLEMFMYLFHSQNKSDQDLLESLPPPPPVKSTLHCDSGPAFIGLHKCAPLFVAPLHLTRTNIATGTWT